MIRALSYTPFSRTFAFVDPDGYIVAVHVAGRSRIMTPARRTTSCVLRCRRSGLG
jgi:hypothetical protein